MAVSNEATITLAVNVQNMAGLRSLTTGLMRLKTQIQALQRSPAIRSASGINSAAQQTRQEAAQIRATAELTRAQQSLARVQGTVAKSGREQAKGAMTLSQKLTQAEQDVDALWRASFRLTMLGSQFTGWSRGILNAFKSVTGSFSEFDFNARRAAGAIDMFNEENTFLGTGAEGSANRLGALSKAALDVSREIKFIPAKEIAEGFYYWGSMTGVVVDSMDKLNELVEGHTSVLKAASMTEVGFEQALKGVYSVIMQFFHGDLSKTTEITEKLFYAAQKTAVEFGDLIQSFKMVGPVAAALGVDFDEVLLTLGELGDLGIRGSMAGRALRQVFIQLVKPSKIAQTVLSGAFTSFKEGFNDLDETVKKSVSDVAKYGSYYEAVFPEGKYAGIKNQIHVLAAMTVNMTLQQRQNMLAVMSTANSVPVLMALVGREVRRIQLGITEDTKMNLADAARYFEDNWRALSGSWKGIVESVARAWDALRITIGGGIAEWAGPLLEFLRDIVDNVREWAEANPRVVATLSKFVAFAGVLSAILGSLLTVAGTLLGFGAAIGYFSKLLELSKPLATATANVATNIGKAGAAASKATTSFSQLAKKGLGVFFLGLASMVALLSAFERNIDYIRLRWEAVIGIFQKGNGDIGNSLMGIGRLLVDIQEGINRVFDLVIRRVIDAVLVVVQLVDGFKQFLDWIGKLATGIPIIEDIGGAFDLAGRALGVLIGARMVQGILAMAAGFIFGRAQVQKYIASVVLAAAVQGGFGTFRGVLAGIAMGFKSAALAAKGFMASTGVGLLIVGLSLLIEELGKSQKSLKETRLETNDMSSAFGESARKAQMMARTIGGAMADLDAKRRKILAEQAAATALGGGIGFLIPDFLKPKYDVPDIDPEALRKLREEYAQKIMSGWMDQVTILNQQLADMGSEIVVDPSRWLDIRVDTRNIAPAIHEANDHIFNAVTNAIAATPIDASLDDIRKTYDNIGQMLNSNLKMTFEVFKEKYFSAAARAAAELKVEQDKWTPAVQAVIDKLMPQTVGDWNNILQEVVVVDGKALTIAQAWGSDKLAPEFETLLSTTVFSAMEDTVESIKKSDVTTPQIKSLGEGIVAVVERFANSAFEGAMPGMIEMLQNFDAFTAGGFGSVDIEDAFAKLFMSPIVGLDEVTMRNAMLDAGSSIPDDTRESYTSALKTLMEMGSEGAAELFKQITPEEAGTDVLADKFVEWYEGIQGSFVEAVKGGIKDSWKTFKEDLKKLLKPKNSDAASLAKLFKIANKKLLLDALSDTDNSGARLLAQDYYQNQLIVPILDGLDLLIAGGGGVKEIEAGVAELASIIANKDVWPNLDPTFAWGMLKWMEDQVGVTFPPALISQLTTIVTDAGIDIVTGAQKTLDDIPDLKLPGMSPTPTGPNGEDPMTFYNNFGSNAQSALDSGGMLRPPSLGGPRSHDDLDPMAFFNNYGSNAQAILNNAGRIVLPAPEVPPTPRVEPPDTTTADAVVNDFSHRAEVIIGGTNTTLPDSNAPKTSDAVTAIRDLTTTIRSLITALGGSAESWGRHFVENFADGIKGSAYLARAAARAVAGATSGFLKFSKPPPGPLNKIREWGRHLVEVYAKAMESNSRRARRAARNIAQNIAEELIRAGRRSGKAADDIARNVNRAGKTISDNANKNRKRNKGIAEDLERTSKKIIDNVRGARTFSNYNEYLKYLEKVHSRIKVVHDKVKKGRQDAVRDLTISKNTKDAKVVYESKNKKIIEIHLIAKSPDGTVRKVELNALRKGIMDALALADLEHMVNVT